MATLHPICILHRLQPSIYPTFISKLKWYLVLHMFLVIVCPVNSFNNEAYGLSFHFKNLGRVQKCQRPSVAHTQEELFSLWFCGWKEAQVSLLPLTCASEKMIVFSHTQWRGSWWIFSSIIKDNKCRMGALLSNFLQPSTVWQMRMCVYYKEYVV